MLVQHLFHPFEVEYVELEECPVSLHRHTFFELVYIMSGKGIHHMNQQSMEYKDDYLYFLLPSDAHYFEIETKTRFLFIRFNDSFLKTQKVQEGNNGAGNWAEKIEFILQYNNHLPGCILYNRNDKPLVKSLAEAIVREYADPLHFHQELVQQLVNILLTIVGRNIYETLPNERAMNSRGNSIIDIVNYIHENIYSPDMLSLEKISSVFNISASYIGEFFKKHTGQGIQQYITEYKIKLIEGKLQYSDLRVGQIASELNFTDASHLIRFFKKYKGISPSEYRKANSSRAGLQ